MEVFVLVENAWLLKKGEDPAQSDAPTTAQASSAILPDAMIKLAFAWCHIVSGATRAANVITGADEVLAKPKPVPTPPFVETLSLPAHTLPIN